MALKFPGKCDDNLPGSPIKKGVGRDPDGKTPLFMLGEGERSFRKGGIDEKGCGYFNHGTGCVFHPIGGRFFI